MIENRDISSNSSNENYFVSMTDLMVGVLFIFIIMLMIFSLNLGEKYDICAESLLKLEKAHEQAIVRAQKGESNLAICEGYLLDAKQALEDNNKQLREVRRTRNRMLEELKYEVDPNGTKVLVDKENGMLRFGADLLFKKGDSNLTTSGLIVIHRVGDAMARILPCYANVSTSPRQTDCPNVGVGRLETVLVEGHTDSDKYPPGSAKNNWILSVERAISTFRILTEENEILSNIKNDSQQDLIGVSGYEARRPTKRLPDQTLEEKKKRRSEDRSAIHHVIAKAAAVD